MTQEHHSSWKSNDNHSPPQNEFIHEEQKRMQIFFCELSSTQPKGNVISYWPSFVEPDVDLTRNTRVLLMFESEHRSLDSKGKIEV